MKLDIKKDLQYYVPLFMGFIIMMIALLAPPLGSIPTSAIYGSGCFLILCASIVGLNVPAMLHEINELKKLHLQELDKIAKLNSTNNETN